MGELYNSGHRLCSTRMWMVLELGRCAPRYLTIAWQTAYIIISNHDPRHRTAPVSPFWRAPIAIGVRGGFTKILLFSKYSSLTIEQSVLQRKSVTQTGIFFPLQRIMKDHETMHCARKEYYQTAYYSAGTLMLCGLPGNRLMEGMEGDLRKVLSFLKTNYIQ